MTEEFAHESAAGGQESRAAGGKAVILVYSTSHALAIEKLLKARGIATALVPVPRHLSSDCGICVRIDASAAVQAEACVVESGIEIQGIREV
jgi:hypothetical protein